MKRWSKLKKELYLLLVPNINFQIHCSVYRMQSQRGSTGLPRYWVTVDGEIVFDYPKQFLDQEIEFLDQEIEKSQLSITYPYISNISDISDVIRNYIDTPKSELPDKIFENDKWGITEYIKLADRRIGIDRLINYSKTIKNENILKVLEARMSSTNKS